MNAITFLKREHNRVKKTFAAIEARKRRFTTKKKMFDALCLDLKVHEHMEQSKWYPALMKDPILKKIIPHLKKEEKKAEMMMKKIKTIKDEEKWAEKVNVFRKNVLHHANEEEKKFFPKVQQRMDEETLKALGKPVFHFKEWKTG